MAETRLERNSWADYDFTLRVFPFPDHESSRQDTEDSYMAITANAWSQCGDKLTARYTLALSNSSGPANTPVESK
ncbi:MAG: hypothetical protein ABTD50_06140 [Polyangiaceae bacterium]|jgi:hypothetical protein